MVDLELQNELAMDIINFLADFFFLFVIMDIIGLVIMMFLEKYDPRTFFAWLILLIFLPPVGFILYMYMGVAFYREHLFRPKDVTDKEILEAADYEKDKLEEDAARFPQGDASMEMAKTLSSIGAWAYTNNNDVTLYTEGKPMMDDMFEAFRGAQKHILIEYYIIRNDKRGNEMMDILTEKVKSGVEVRLLTDAFGIGKGPKAGIKRFIRAGGHYGMFHSSWNLMLSPKKNHRNHRKIAIIDGKTVFCGGFNVGDEYEGYGPLGHWRDASIKTEGASIIPLMVRFSADWQYAKKRDPLQPLDYYIDHSVREHHGDDRMQVVSGGADTMPSNPVQMQYLAMAAKAKRRLYITTPYLIPDDDMIITLQNAARMGVDVRILMPDKKDHIFLYWNNETFANELMKAGVRVYRYNDGFIHEKMVIMDDDCLSVGSANLDIRSLTLNFETNTMIYSERLTKQAADQFLEDLKVSTEYSCEKFMDATVMMKIRRSVSYMFKLLS